jgi:hypothetical protein
VDIRICTWLKKRIMHTMQPNKFLGECIILAIFLEIQNLGCYRPIPLKRNLSLEIQTCSEITQGNLL